MQHLLEPLSPLDIESRVDRMRAAGAFEERPLEAQLVELANDVSGGLVMTAEGPGDLVGGVALSAREQDLAAPKDEGIRERKPAFRVLRSSSESGRTKIGSFMRHRINPRLPSRLEMH
jgi:hypothetical protein